MTPFLYSSYSGSTAIRGQAAVAADTRCLFQVEHHYNLRTFSLLLWLSKHVCLISLIEVAYIPYQGEWLLLAGRADRRDLMSLLQISEQVNSFLVRSRYSLKYTHQSP
jgi:hypothetical protein